MENREEKLENEVLETEALDTEEHKKEEKISWTKEQSQVIWLRNRNILVSAAAGSGKTAVLVERIITMITNKENPVDIDRLLIVTFTNAAAAEMRERIGQAIEKKILEEPDNAHLQKQTTLLHSALITTLHSFCLDVIHNHFNTIDLEPGFRIADEAELQLMKGDVVSDLLEKRYEERDPAFLQFVESYATGKTDAGIEELILHLHRFSMSYPWPREWLEERRSAFQIEDIEQMEQCAWMQTLLEYVRVILNDAKAKNQRALELCLDADGPLPYQDALLADQELLNNLICEKTYEGLQKAFSDLSWKRLSPKKGENISEEKKELVKEIREDIKKAVTDLKKQFFFQNAEEMLADLKGVEPAMNALIDLTLAFLEAFEREKEEKRVVDFNDLEHFALRILVKREEAKGEKKVVPTIVAEDYSEYFEEILVDEYQDSNLVQETILNSISREKFGHPNLFMVGDVKQSIYKFRLARPELFMEKYNTYSLEDGLYQRIDLHKNFRSREVVLESINFIFEQIMHRSLGNIEYDKDAALYPGAFFPEETEKLVSTDSELMFVTDEAEADASEEADKETEEAEYSARELEARAVAMRIKELTCPETGLSVMDKKTKGYRLCHYGDIVILLRTMSGWSEVFLETLMAHGISAYTDTQSGYFSTVEIKTILNFLRVIDNPRQDIPLAAVMHSLIGGFSSEELAHIRGGYASCELYDAVAGYAASEEEAEYLPKKVQKFLNLLEYFREEVPYTSMHQLLELIYEKTKYYDMVSVMPGGERRKNNLSMLIQKAVDFENSSYSGLFHFNRYMEKLHKYEVDFGEAATDAGHENAVRIMSIHKSKGLEFPVVFVSGMGKVFNNQDSRSKLVLHPDMGLGPDFVDLTKRTKSPTLIKKVIQRQTVLENLGEELRVLYVALTRAKEKLIMTGYVKKLEEQMKQWRRRGTSDTNTMGYYEISLAKQYFDWVVPAVIQTEKKPYLSERIVRLKQLSLAELGQQIKTEIKKEELLCWDETESFDASFRKVLEERVDYTYPFAAEQELKSKITVTELKRLAHLEEEEAGEALFGTEEEGTLQEEIPLPKFLQKTEAISATRMGTLYHKVVECIRLDDIKKKEDVEQELKRLGAEGKITQEDAERVNGYKIYQFAVSDIAKRIKEAERENRVWREVPFVIGIPAKEIQADNKCKSEEPILVQGMIDLYIEETDGLVLVDYKTDYVEAGGENRLKERYRIQLDYYQKALEQLSGKKVKERIIYSFGLQKEIRV